MGMRGWLTTLDLQWVFCHCCQWRLRRNCNERSRYLGCNVSRTLEAVHTMQHYGVLVGLTMTMTTAKPLAIYML